MIISYKKVLRTMELQNKSSVKRLPKSPNQGGEGESPKKATLPLEEAQDVFTKIFEEIEHERLAQSKLILELYEKVLYLIGTIQKSYGHQADDNLQSIMAFYSKILDEYEATSLKSLKKINTIRQLDAVTSGFEPFYKYFQKLSEILGSIDQTLFRLVSEVDTLNNNKVSLVQESFEVEENFVVSNKMDELIQKLYKTSNGLASFETILKKEKSEEGGKERGPIETKEYQENKNLLSKFIQEAAQLKEQIGIYKSDLETLWVLYNKLKVDLLSSNKLNYTIKAQISKKLSEMKNERPAEGSDNFSDELESTKMMFEINLSEAKSLLTKYANENLKDLVDFSIFNNENEERIRMSERLEILKAEVRESQLQLKEREENLKKIKLKSYEEQCEWEGKVEILNKELEDSKIELQKKYATTGEKELEIKKLQDSNIMIQEQNKKEQNFLNETIEKMNWDYNGLKEKYDVLSGNYDNQELLLEV